MKAAMFLMVREFYKRKNFGGKGLLVNTVHDAAYVDAADEVADEAAGLLDACMKLATQKMRETFSWEIPLDIPTDTEYGRNMQETDSLSDKGRELSLKYQAEIRAAL